MAGGETIIGIVLGAGTLIALAYAGSRLIAAVAANKLPPLPIYGDFPNVPGELKASAESFGAGGTKMGAGLRRTNRTQRTDPFRTMGRGADR